jgi:hypothetical protein
VPEGGLQGLLVDVEPDQGPVHGHVGVDQPRAIDRIFWKCRLTLLSRGGFSMVEGLAIAGPGEGQYR